jgi:hypothetical protein
MVKWADYPDRLRDGAQAIAVKAESQRTTARCSLDSPHIRCAVAGLYVYPLQADCRPVAFGHGAGECVTYENQMRRKV